MTKPPYTIIYTIARLVTVPRSSTSGRMRGIRLPSTAAYDLALLIQIMRTVKDIKKDE